MNNEIITITPKDLADMLVDREKKGATFISLSAFTDAGLKKTLNPYLEAGQKVLKLSHVSAVLGFDYVAANERLLSKDGLTVDFVPKKRTWGTHYRNSRSVIQHISSVDSGSLKYYVQVMVRRSLTSPVFFHKTVQGFTQTIAKERLASFLPSPRKDGGILVKEYSLDNILMLCIDKKKYRII